MKVRIEGAGHCVEVEVDQQSVSSNSDIIETVQKVWETTRVVQPRMSVGYGSQLTSQTDDQPIHGAGQQQRQVTPVTA